VIGILIRKILIVT